MKQVNFMGGLRKEQRDAPSAWTCSDGTSSSTNDDPIIGLISSRHSTQVLDSNNFTSAITAAH
jgi:hypothetical protein